MLGWGPQVIVGAVTPWPPGLKENQTMELEKKKIGCGFVYTHAHASCKRNSMKYDMIRAIGIAPWGPQYAILSI